MLKSPIDDGIVGVALKSICSKKISTMQASWNAPLYTCIGIVYRDTKRRHYRCSKSIATHSLQIRLGEWGGLDPAPPEFYLAGEPPQLSCPKNMGKKVNHTHTEKNKFSKI